MKLIFCLECSDVVRLKADKWKKCECGKSGGQYIKGVPVAVVGGNCRVFGIANPFFSEIFPYLNEAGKQWWREKHKYGKPNTSDCWYGEYPGDDQIYRIKDADGPILKTKSKALKGENKGIIELTVIDDRKFVISEKVGYKGYKDIYRED